MKGNVRFRDHLKLEEVEPDLLDDKFYVIEATMLLLYLSANNTFSNACLSTSEGLFYWSIFAHIFLLLNCVNTA